MSWFTANETLIQTALILALLGYSIQLAARSGALSLAGVGFFGIGGFAVGDLLKHGWSMWVAIIVVVIGAALIGAVLSLVFARVRGLYFAMGTLAFTLFTQTLARTWSTFTGGANGIYAIPLDMTSTGLAIMVVIVMVYAFVTERGSHGRKLRLLHNDELLAGSLGVRIRRERVIALLLSAVCGAAAGAGQALTFGYFAPNQISFELATSAVIVVVIGGTTSWLGPPVGAFIVAWLPSWLSSVGGWEGVVQGMIAVVLVVLVPGGIMGAAADLTRKAHTKLRPGASGPAQPPAAPTTLPNLERQSS